MPHLSASGRGNLFARLRVKLPEKLSDRERELFEELRDAEERGTGNKERGTDQARGTRNKERGTRRTAHG
jgi:DnaJ-class molecular chaperone